MSWYTPKRLDRLGYVQYPLHPFVEDLDLIVQLIGSTNYEVLEADGATYIRRAD